MLGKIFVYEKILWNVLVTITVTLAVSGVNVEDRGTDRKDESIGKYFFISLKLRNRIKNTKTEENLY